MVSISINATEGGRCINVRPATLTQAARICECSEVCQTSSCQRCASNSSIRLFRCDGAGPSARFVFVNLPHRLSCTVRAYGKNTVVTPSQYSFFPLKRPIGFSWGASQKISGDWLLPAKQFSALG